MSGPVVVAVAVAGVLAGWGVGALVARLPEPSEVGRSTRIAVAAVNAAAWAVVAATWQRWWQVVPYLLLVSTLVCVSTIDARVYRIPNKVVFPFLALSLALLLVASTQLFPGEWWEPYRNGLAGGGLYFAFLFIPHLVYPKGMGMGDVKLALVMGLYLGWGFVFIDAVSNVIWGLLVGSVLGVLSGMVVNIVRRRGGAFPFGPSLALGCFIVLVQVTGPAV
jgi:leader peptidase (prepilin peptidase)/N-methyltransferase